MPNPIKYSTGSETDALKKGNLYIGTGDVGKGPSDVTGYYQGVDAPSSGYTIYLYNENSSSNLSYHVANNDEELISFTNGISNQTFTSATECLNYYVTQTDKVCFNKNYEPIITDGLIYNLDAGFISSYTQSGTTWYSVAQSAYTATLTNSPTFSTSDGGTFVFDGINDFIAGNGVSGIGYSKDFTISIWLKSNGGGYVFMNSGPDGQFGIYNYNNGTVVSAFVLSNIYYTVNQTITTNVWTNIVVTNKDQQLSIYASLNKGVNGGTPINVGNSGLRIGRRNRTSELWFNGSISQLQIYNRALSENEITQNYNALKGRFGL
jgi:hypothetical protein